MKILVFLPTYNEADNLPALLRDLFSLNLNIHALVVDDQSPDGTGSLADRIALERSVSVTVIHRQAPRGRGRAGIDGLRWASHHPEFDYTIEMDADGSHPVRFIPDFLTVFEKFPSTDLVIGSRHLPESKIEGWPKWRHLNSAAANRLARLLLGLPSMDITSGYRCYRTETLTRLPWDTMTAAGPAIVEEILLHCYSASMLIREIPITFIERSRGKSKVSPALILQWIREIISIRRLK